MKVVAVNGSPKAKGNTAYALNVALEEIKAQGIETEMITLGSDNYRPCIGCGACAKKRNRKCTFSDDGANELFETMFTADGILLGSPVYYSGMTGNMKAVLDRAFFTAAQNGGLFRHKVGAGIAVARRAGSVTTSDQLQKYLSISEVFIPTSSYWAEIHGLIPGEAEKDAEGVQIMRMLGKNMAWLLKIIAHGKAAVPPPAPEAKIFTSFIR